jgi:hypothetical protein
LKWPSERLTEVARRVVDAVFNFKRHPRNESSRYYSKWPRNRARTFRRDPRRDRGKSGQIAIARIRLLNIIHRPRGGGRGGRRSRAFILVSYHPRHVEYSGAAPEALPDFIARLFFFPIKIFSFSIAEIAGKSASQSPVSDAFLDINEPRERNFRCHINPMESPMDISQRSSREAENVDSPDVVRG